MTEEELKESIDHYTKLIDTGIDYRDGKEIPKHILPFLFIRRHDLEKEFNERQKNIGG